MARQEFFAGIAIGIIIATISSYYFFCRPEAHETRTGIGYPVPVQVAGPGVRPGS